jgi:tetratricopeptide (TPR) repeat protein
MSMPHHFTDDPNSFPGPPTKSSNTTVILVAIAIICGTLMLICGGVIFGVVTSVRQAQQDFEITMGDEQWNSPVNRSAFQEYSGFVAEGRYAEAIESVDEGLNSDPDNAFLHNNKAWLLATCPDDAVRDGELAVEHAIKACDLTDWKNFAYVDTAAAAYAESGDFELAVKWQEEAIQLGGGEYSQDFQKRLRLFKAGKPYREGVPPFKEMSEEVTEPEQPAAADVAETPNNDTTGTTTSDEQPN